jgi:hypothetical protein
VGLTLPRQGVIAVTVESCSGAEDLDRRVPLVLEIVGQAHGGHAALAELALEPVGGAECLLELIAEVDGRGRRDEGM